MSTLSLQTRKLNIIEYLAITQDEKLFSEIEDLVAKSQQEVHPPMKKISKKELHARAAQSELEIQNNQTLSQKRLEKETMQW